MDVNFLRSQIPATRKVIYMNTGWSGPNPAPVLDKIREWLDYEANESPTSPHVLERHRQLQQDTRIAVARLINASPEEISLTQNTTEGINIILNGMAWRAGDELVTTNLEHASGIVPCYYIARRKRVKIRIVDLIGVNTPSLILERFESAITPKTRLILLSHVMYLNGLCLPLKEIQALASDRNILVLVDAAQSAGQMPLDMKDLGCDFYSLPGHKWLLGPDGTGALYIRNELIPHIQPAKVGHHAVSSYDFKGNWEPEIQSIRKFELTTFSDPLLAGFIAATDFLMGIGLQSIQERVCSLSNKTAERLSSISGVTVTSPRHPQLVSGLVSFSVEGADPQIVVNHLWEHSKIVCRWVNDPPGVRLSLDFFNTGDEIEKVVDCLKELKV